MPQLDSHPQMTFVRPLLALLVGALGSSPALATFTVIDDDLLPSSILEARDTRTIPSEGAAVPFFKGSTTLGPMGRKAVEEAYTNALADATYKIIGRNDAMPATVQGTDGTSVMTVAAARANAIRQQLLRLGVPSKNIILAPDASPNPQTNGSNYLSHIVVVTPNTLPGSPALRTALTPNLTTISVPAAQPAMARNAPAPTAPAPTAPAPTPATAPPPALPPTATATAGAPAISDQAGLVNFINGAVRNGTMDASVALTLLSRLLHNGAAPSVQSTQPAPVPMPANYAPARPPVLAPAPVPAAPPSPPPAFVATNPALAAKPVWQVDKNFTLRDNLNDWSKKAGWHPSQWEASNYYEVTRSFQIEGDFPEMLREIADGTGLNICANKRLRIVRVTDHGTRCDKDN